MPQKLTDQELKNHGIQNSGSRMDNGEYRFRLMKGEETGSFGYILTEMPEGGAGWQNSHYHRGVMETYIVQHGWIGYADLMPDGTARFYRYGPGHAFTTRPGQEHNVYMPSGAVIHTVKHGDTSLEKDWFASELLDGLTKHITEEELLRLPLG